MYERYRQGKLNELPTGDLMRPLTAASTAWLDLDDAPESGDEVLVLVVFTSFPDVSGASNVEAHILEG